MNGEQKYLDRDGLGLYQF